MRTVQSDSPVLRRRILPPTTSCLHPPWRVSARLQARLGDRLGRAVTRSELTYLLIKAEREQAAAADETPWPEYYARVLLET